MSNLQTIKVSVTCNFKIWHIVVNITYAISDNAIFFNKTIKSFYIFSTGIIVLK